MKSLNKNNQDLIIGYILLFFCITFMACEFIPIIEHYIDELVLLLSEIIAFVTKTEFFTVAIGAFSGAAGGAWIIHRYEKTCMKNKI